MTSLRSRLDKLEKASGPNLPPLAVVAAGLPAEVDDRWAAELLTRHGWLGGRLNVVVRDGDDEVLLAPTPMAWVKDQAERIWLEAGSSYPNATITSSAEGCFATRFENEAAMSRWMLKTEKELAA